MPINWKYSFERHFVMVSRSMNTHILFFLLELRVVYQCVGIRCLLEDHLETTIFDTSTSITIFKYLDDCVL